MITNIESFAASLTKKTHAKYSIIKRCYSAELLNNSESDVICYWNKHSKMKILRSLDVQMSESIQLRSEITIPEF